MNHSTTRCILGACVAVVASFATPAFADVAVYDDAVAANWSDWSWGGVTRNFAGHTVVHAGSSAIAVTYTGGWSGLQLGRLSGLVVAPNDTFRFQVHGGPAGGQTVEVVVSDDTSGATATLTFAPAAGTWTRIDVPLDALGTSAQVTTIQWFNATPGSQPVFYLDDLAFVSSGNVPPDPTAGPALHIDAQSGHRAISSWLYGINFADETLASTLHLPLRRWGGNSTTRYNWMNDTSNHASDWFFENIPEDNAAPGLLPDGSTTDLFVEQDKRTGTDTLLTMPLIGWTPKARATSCGFPVSVYGPQQSVDPYDTDCGNGLDTAGTPITGNNPSDTSQSITPAFVQNWMAHLTAKYGSAASGGVRFYDLDNEPDLWNSTHRDVHPDPAGYDELRDRALLYAPAIKAGDPGALTLGPTSWGWTGYFWSSLDWSAGGSWWNSPQDRLAHGDVPFVDWYLQQMHAYEQQHGLRILDYLDLHYYPQASGVSLSGAGDSATQALRLRSTRSLWDSSYVDESWIGEPVRLIPRMRDWVAGNYPGTGIAITEYNWGAPNHINGALAEADVLGIFGREGVDVATLWDPPTVAQPLAFAFRMYRNYDGAGGAFGNTGVAATSDDQSRLAVYGALTSGDANLTIIVVNKTALPLTSDLSLAGFTPSAAAAVYRYSGANLASIVREADQAVDAGGLHATFPASSITLLVVPGSGTPPPPATCGNGVLEPGEQCDDANTTAGDGCNAACRFELLPGSKANRGAALASGCAVEWSVVNPGNSPHLDRDGFLNSVQTCTDNDPACDFDLDPADSACEFRVAICVNNLDPALATCTPQGVAASLRVLSPRSSRDPANAAALATALANLRDPATGESGLALPIAAGRVGVCSAPFALRVPLRASPTPRPVTLKVKTRATFLAGTARDTDMPTFRCLP